MEKEKNTKHEQTQEMTRKNKNETHNECINMGRIGYNS